MLFVLSLVVNPTIATIGCEHVIHIGDSLSLPMQNELKNNYLMLGAPNVILSVGNGRSLRYAQSPDTVSGLDAIEYWRNKLNGSTVCWVVALGTNDSATNDPYEWQDRLDALLEAVDGDTVVMVNVWYHSNTRPEYSEEDADEWNAMLTGYVARYPNFNVFDWATLAENHPEWFLYDGIHYGTLGATARVKLVSEGAMSIFAMKGMIHGD
jgi:hypothetical protein